MMSGRRDGFPHGLVLGLTMAESAILIVFVLLLAMTVLVGRESARRQSAEKELELCEDIHEIMRKHGLDKDGLSRLLSTYKDVRRDSEKWWKLLGLVDKLVPERTPEAIAARVREAGGSGTDHPSCWYDDDSSVVYLFDVALTDGGFVLWEALSPQHHHKRTLLPLGDVVTGRTLTTEQFLAQTRPLFQWSVDSANKKECRFFVRAFDHTAPNQKELYKTRMRTLESRFYKNASPSGPSPFIEPAPPLP